MLSVTVLLDGAQHCCLGVQGAKEISIPFCKAFNCEICTQEHPRFPHLKGRWMHNHTQFTILTKGIHNEQGKFEMTYKLIYTIQRLVLHTVLH